MSPLEVLREVEWAAYRYIGLEPCTHCGSERPRHEQGCALEAALAQVETLVEAAREVLADGGVLDIDPRLRYVTVQLSRETLPALRSALAPFQEADDDR
jgi:hypothetical protein